MTTDRRVLAHRVISIGLGLALIAACTPALAQSSPFLTGANALQSNILAWATPIAVILVMVLGVMAMANRISWGVADRGDPRDRDCLRSPTDRGVGAGNVWRVGAP